MSDEKLGNCKNYSWIYGPEASGLWKKGGLASGAQNGCFDQNWKAELD